MASVPRDAARPKRGRGRPPVENPRTVRLETRVTPDEAERIAELAARAGLSLAAYLRLVAQGIAIVPPLES